MTKKAKQTKGKTRWGFDIKDIDTKVRPQDDFYKYANNGWLKKNTIPPEESRWGSFTILRYQTEHQVKKVIETARVPLIKNMYASAMDMKRRNALGVTPLLPWRKKIDDVELKDDLFALISELHVAGMSGFFNTIVDQDSKDSSVYLMHLWQGGLGLPERDYYLLDGAEQKRVRDAYLAYMSRMLALSGYKKDEVARIQKNAFAIEIALAKVSMNKEDVRDAEKTYHKKTLKELQTLAPALDWKKYFTETHAPGIRHLIVGQPEFYKALNELLENTPLDELKDYLQWHILMDSAGLLSEKFVKENFAFWGTTLSGTKKMRALWRRALGATNAVVGEEVGKLYVRTYFPSASKKAMDALVSDLFVAYEERIKKLDWMSPATKRKAIVKLRAISRKIGYPITWRSYKGLVIKANDYFGNMHRSSVYEHMRQMKKLRNKVDRTEWHMTPQTVNAYCNFNLNEIVFPAAILQWPFFDMNSDAAVNYAGIGSVIGHEMTHAFDDQGAKFDGQGNMRKWWTETDFKKFNAKGQILRKQYDAFEVEPGVNVNGQLTLGENIADLGGLCIAWDAYQRYLAKTGRKVIDGLTPEQRFFLGFAQQERELARPEFSKMMALVDPHSPHMFRINGPISNFAPFYETFGVKKGDKLYRDPKIRAEIW